MAGYSGIAERLKVAMEKVIELAEAAADDLPYINATRGDRAVAALLPLVTGGLFGVTVERALVEKGERIVGVLSIASAVRSTPMSFYDAFKSASGGEEPSEARKLTFRIATLLTDPLVRTILAGRQGAEIRVEEKTENGKRLVHVTFVEDGRELLKTAWEAGKRLKPLWAEGEVVKLFKEVVNLMTTISSGSKLLEGLNEEAWGNAVKTMGRVKEAIETTVKAVVIGALPTDAVIYSGSEYVSGPSSYLSQAFTYWALAEGEINLDKVYPSEEGLRAMWYVVGEYTKIVDDVLKRGRVALERLLKSGVDLKAVLAEVKMSDEIKTALETAAGDFWSRVGELLTRWEEAEKNGDKEAVDRLGKYLRVLLPLAYAVEAYKRGELSREEAALAVTFAVLYDGAVYRDEIQLVVGAPEHEVNPIMTHDHFAAFWLWALKVLGFKPSSVRKGRKAHYIAFRGDELNELLKVIAPTLPRLYEFRDALAEFADAFRTISGEVVKRKYGIEWAYDIRNEGFFKKLEEIITMAEDYVYKNIAVERDTLDTSWSYPKTVIRFKLGGEEIAYINVYWTGDGLQAQFGGSRENAERLASIIRALGGEAEVKHVKGAGWVVKLATDGITAIRHDGWLKAVRSFVDELYNKGQISEERYEQLVKDITAGPNTVKLAGVEFSVNYINKTGNIEIVYQPTSETSKNAAVDALKARGLVEGVHFTVTTKGAKRYEIRDTKETYTKAVEVLARSGLKEKEHYTVYDKRREIHVKAEQKDAVVNALKAAGLEEGKHFTVKWGGQYIIRLTYDGLRQIQHMALNGDAEADRFIRELEDVLRRRYGNDVAKKLTEVLRPAREEGTAELPLTVRDKRGNVVAQVVGLRYEFVKNGQLVDQCAGEDCRLRIIAEYEAGGERRQFKMEWYWAEKREKKGDATVTYYYEIARPTVKDDVEVAVLKTLTGKEAERGRVYLYADQLDALRRFKPLRDAIDKWREGKPASSQGQGQSNN
ncbi:MAG: PaRep2b protein [Pyrobaculum sp.]